MITAGDYRMVVEVLKQHNASELSIEFYQSQAEKLEAKDEYAFRLGSYNYQNRNEGFMTQGYRLMSQLLDDGWTPPEGLF